ncbi:MAG: hypothetical protein V4534_07955 [Myxococcota bacterium]
MTALAMTNADNDSTQQLFWQAKAAQCELGQDEQTNAIILRARAVLYGMLAPMAAASTMSVITNKIRIYDIEINHQLETALPLGKIELVGF